MPMWPSYSKKVRAVARGRSLWQKPRLRGRPYRVSPRRAIGALLWSCLLAVTVAACDPAAKDARQELAKQGVDFSPAEFVGRALAGDAAVVDLFLKAAMDINATDPSGTTPLIAAAGAGHDQIVRALLDRGANPNVRDLGGHTALMIAANNGRAGAVRALLDRDADRMAQNVNGYTAVAYARLNGHPKIAVLLEPSGAQSR